MDRTAWIVVILCVIGLLTWTWWTRKHQPPRPVPPALSPTPLPLATASASAAPLTPPSPTTAATATPAAEATPAFAEKAEILRNDDDELRLTNRGGGIREATLLNPIRQDDQALI